MVTWFVAGATVVEAAAVVIAVLYAKGQLAELRASREETTRPFVVVDLDVARTMIFLTVKNIGQSIAKNVRFRFSPELESTWDGKRSELTESGEYRVAELDIFANGIPSLAPGKEHSTVFDQTLTRLPVVLPKRYDVEVSFDAPSGRRFTDRQTLSLDTYLGLTHVEKKGVHEIAKTLDDIKREIKGWGASGGGLRVATDDDIRARFARFMEPEAGGDDDDAAEDAPPESEAPGEQAA